MSGEMDLTNDQLRSLLADSRLGALEREYVLDALDPCTRLVDPTWEVAVRRACLSVWQRLRGGV